MVIYIFLPSTDNNRACSNSSKVGKFDHRRPKTRTSAFSTIKDRPTQIWFFDMYLLYVNNDQVFSTQSRVIFTTHCVWLMSIPPATLQVTQEHCICNQITISFDYFYLITKPTTVFPSRLSSHASQYLFTSIHHLTQSSHELTDISSAYQYILLFICTM